MNDRKIRRGNQEVGGQTVKKRTLFHKDKSKALRVHRNEQPYEYQPGNYRLERGMQ